MLFYYTVPRIKCFVYFSFLRVGEGGGWTKVPFPGILTQQIHACLFSTTPTELFFILDLQKSKS